MGEWWTYSLSDFLMFSPGTYFRLFELHNQAWFPLQPLFALPAVWLLWVASSGSAAAWRAPVVLLGFIWIWVAWVFHLERYAPINWAAVYGAWAFAAQGVVLVVLGLAGRHLRISRSGFSNGIGMALLPAALMYPLLALALQRPWAQSEWFGLMPDPTALGTLGLMLCLQRTDGRAWHPGRTLCMAVPAAWCAVSGATQWTMGVQGWFLLPALAAFALLHPVLRRPA